MDKTAFIPKKTPAKPFYKAKGPGLFFGFTLVLLIISGLFSGGVYFYKKLLEKRVDILDESLKRAHAAFEPELIIELSRTAEKIDSSKILLEEHKALTSVFDFLQETTLKSVQFFKFDYKFSEDDEAVISMGGTTNSYSSLAFQIEEFQKNKNVKNVSVANLSLAGAGAVNFSMEIAFNQNFIKYKAK